MIIINEENKICIDNDGFLNESDFDGAIVKEYTETFSFLESINTYMYELYEKLEPKDDDIIGCFFAGTYSNIHKNVQSAIILATRGLQDQVKIFIRTILDKLMIMQAVKNDYNNYNKWLNSQEAQREGLVKAIKRGDKGLEHLQSKIPLEIDFSSAQRVNQKDWAKMAEMEVDYNIVYKLFSGNIHYSMASFDDDFEYQDNKPVALSIFPKVNEIEKLLITVAEYALQTASINLNYFELDDTKYKRLDLCLEQFQSKLMEREKLKGK